MCEKAAAEHGKTVSRENWRLVTLMHIAETREEARRVEFGLENFADYFRISTFQSSPTTSGQPTSFWWRTGLR